MTLKDLTLHPTSRALRQFSAAWLVFLVAWGAYWGLVRHQAGLGLGLGVLGAGVGVAGLAWPPCVRWLYVAAMALAFPVGWVVSLLLLAVMYFLIITPVALYFRLRGRDLLGLRPQPGRESFWVPKQMPDDIRRYFKQY